MEPEILSKTRPWRSKSLKNGGWTWFGQYGNHFSPFAKERQPKQADDRWLNNEREN